MCCDLLGVVRVKVLITKAEAMISKLLAVLVIVLISLAASPIHARSLGAPVNACGNLRQQHLTEQPVVCGPPCPFRIRLTHIDGVVVPAAEEGFYRCGATHTCM